jgi:hypothetical protein
LFNLFVKKCESDVDVNSMLTVCYVTPEIVRQTNVQYSENVMDIDNTPYITSQGLVCRALWNSLASGEAACTGWIDYR